MDFKAGDYVELKTKDSSYRGLVMPRPDLADKDHVILKLDNGYNVGIRVKDIKSSKKAAKPATPKPPKTKIKINKNLPQVSIVSTGGTIASKIDYETGGVVALSSAEDLITAVPELNEFIQLKTVQAMNDMSENFNPSIWGQIAEAVAKELKVSEGVVVTHGTDTMHYSTAALSFMLPDLGKPVVFTGSQRSSDRGSSDSFLNLLCSAQVARSDIAEVSLVMHGSPSDNFCNINRGTRVRKMHTSRRDAFRSINEKPIGQVWPNGEIKAEGYRKRSGGAPKPDTRFEEKVALIKDFPGFDTSILDFLIDNDYKGIVIEATGLGHVPVRGKSWLESLKRAIEQDITIVITSQCLYGRVHPFVYSNLRKVSSLGAIYAEDMLPEVAYVKLGCILGRKLDPKEEMTKNWAGEVSKCSGFEFSPEF